MGSRESHSPQEAIYLKLQKHTHKPLMLIRVRFPGLWNVSVFKRRAVRVFVYVRQHVADAGARWELGSHQRRVR